MQAQESFAPMLSGVPSDRSIRKLAATLFGAPAIASRQAKHGLAQGT
jgi:hypothetical protein